jgi:hypothetical protein
MPQSARSWASACPRRPLPSSTAPASSRRRRRAPPPAWRALRALLLQAWPGSASGTRTPQGRGPSPRRRRQPTAHWAGGASQHTSQRRTWTSEQGGWGAAGPWGWRLVQQSPGPAPCPAWQTSIIGRRSAALSGDGAERATNGSQDAAQPPHPPRPLPAPAAQGLPGRGCRRGRGLWRQAWAAPGGAGPRGRRRAACAGACPAPPCRARPCLALPGPAWPCLALPGPGSAPAAGQRIVAAGRSCPVALCSAQRASPPPGQPASCPLLDPLQASRR